MQMVKEMPRGHLCSPYGMANYVFKIAQCGNPCGAPQIPGLCGEDGDDRGPFADGEEGRALVFRAEIRNSGARRAGDVSSGPFIYRPERTAGMDSSPLIRIPTVLPPRVAFRMPGPVPWFIAETAAECLGTDKQYKPSHVPGHARSAIQLRKHSVGQKCSPVIGWTANDRAIGWT